MHRIYRQARRDPQKKPLPTMFICSEDEIAQIINDWDQAWKIPLTEEEEEVVQ